MTEEATGAISETVKTAARAVLDFSASCNPATGIFNFSLRIEDKWLARGIAVGAFTCTLAALYLRHRENTERAVRNGLEGTAVDGRPDPEVREIGPGSLLVKLQCHTPRSFLQFVSDYESQKVKQRLEEELSKIGFTEELSITIENIGEVEEHKKKLGYASQMPNINFSGNPAPTSEDLQSAFPDGADVKFLTLETKRVFDKVQCRRGGEPRTRVENGLIEMEASVYPGDVLMKINVWVFREEEAAEILGDKNGRVALPVLMGEHKMDKVGAVQFFVTSKGPFVDKMY